MSAVVAFLARIILRLLFRVRVEGAVPAAPTGRMLIVANHQSFLDGVLLGAFLPFEPVYLVNTAIAARRHFKFLLRFVSHITIDPSNPMAIKQVAALIESGRPAMIFPEGRITMTGGLMKVYDGPAFLAAKTGADVFAVRIDGAVRTHASRMGPWFHKKLFPKITLTFLPPRRIPMPEARRARDRRRLASEEMRRILQLAVSIVPAKNLHEAFLDSIRMHGRGSLLFEDIRQTPETFGQTLKAALALGRIVSKLTQPGEYVGVLLPNLSTTVSLLFGMFSTGRIPAMLNYTSGPSGLSNACKLACVKTVITSKAFLAKAGLEDTVNRIPDVRIVCLEDLRPLFTAGDKLWLILRALPFPRSVMTPVPPEHPAIVLFTSGSEGLPKGVVLSHRSILANCSQMLSCFNVSERDKLMSALPMFHAFGIVGFMIPVLTGCRAFLYPSPLHYRVIPEISYDRDCSVLIGTNTFLLNYAKSAHPYDFYCMRYVLAGAEKLNEDTRKLWMEKFGIRLLEGYGATECSPVIAVNTEFGNRSGTVGQLMPWMEHRIVETPGIESGGALHVKGPNVMLGYLSWDEPGAIRPPSSSLGPGWYDTGDIVEMEDGYIRIKGRLKRFAKIAGEMISLEVVERIAGVASPGKEHAATTQSDGRRGELVVLYTEDANLKRERLQAAAREAGLPELAIPKRVVAIAKLPLLGNGKRDYVRLKAMAEESAAVPQ